MRIDNKGFHDLRPKDNEKLVFDPLTAKFSESENIVTGFTGRQLTLLGQNGEHVGDLLLVRDARDDSWVKIKVIGVGKSYRGSQAVNSLYGKSFQVAKDENKDLVMDSAVSIAAYKSFLKYLQDHNYLYEENPLNQFHEGTQTYQASDSTYTVRVKKESFH